MDRIAVSSPGMWSQPLEDVRPQEEWGFRTALRGEDAATTRWEDARHWLSIYTDLLNFKHALKDRVRLGLSALAPTAQAAAVNELEIIQRQMDVDELRIHFWRRRLRDLDGLHLNREGATVRYQAGVATLTRREFQLLSLLLDNPHGFFTSRQIVAGAWADESLSDEQARTYISRLRKVLIRLNVPADIARQPKRGYSLVFRGERRYSFFEETSPPVLAGPWTRAEARSTENADSSVQL